ncbi:MAG: [protein-PII] uridylyltransferase [Hyphomicrobiales bacterium]
MSIERKTAMRSIHETASRQLQEKIADLTDRFLRGRQPDFMKQHARVLDDFFEQAFETSMIGPRMEINKNPYAIIALGGYGREEQCLHSDVDLLFLFGKRIPSEAEHLIREMIYPLWDIGMDVGYSTRSLKECLSLAAKDLNVLTPILDARFICGMSMLYSELMAQLRDKVIRKHADRLMDELVAYTRSRHAQYGDSAYLLEPNLKEGQGGLRDYHTMLWMARLEVDLHQPRDLEYYGMLSHAEFQDLWDALGFIWITRNHLHRLCRRKYDQLHFENQIAIAERMKYKSEDGQQPVERFLGELHSRMERVKQQHLMLLHEIGPEKKGRRRSTPKIPVEGIEIVSWGMLNFTGPEVILKRPELLMRIFEESARLKMPLSGEAKRLVKEFVHLVDPVYRSAPEIVRAFERILLAPEPAAGLLDDMLTTGFLGAFIPEFLKISNRIQYDEYHLYPVDKHLLRTVQTVKQLAGEDRTSEPLFARIFRELKNRVLLVWAALLHDIGKAEVDREHSETGAEMVRRILTEKALTPAEVETVAFLVSEHLYLIKTATRRDIHDEETAIVCARRIKDIERLKMLYLLTVADSIATGPAAWNDWTSHLLREFFLKVLNVLEKGELASEKAVAAIERKREALMSAADSEAARRDIEAAFPVLTPRYLLSVAPENIASHIGLFHRLELKKSDFVWDIHPSSEGATRTVTICAKDRPGLVASMAGVFTLNNINILDVQVFTWRNGTALDIFEVTPPPDRIFEEDKWRRAEENLKAVLSGRLDLANALKPRLEAARMAKPRTAKRPHRVKVDNTSSGFFTIIEVFTYDFQGLLYSIADALFRAELDIWVAKIATKVDQVVDVFYVRDLSGQKVDSPERVAAIEGAVLQRLPPLE